MFPERVTKPCQTTVVHFLGCSILLSNYFDTPIIFSNFLDLLNMEPKMIAAAEQNKPIHFFRRFMEGWFSVYLCIFAVTLLVRLLFFSPNISPNRLGSLANSGFHTEKLLRGGIQRVLFSAQPVPLQENEVSFGSQNELTAN